MTQCLTSRSILTPMTCIRVMGTDGKERAMMRAVRTETAEEACPCLVDAIWVSTVAFLKLFQIGAGCTVQKAAQQKVTLAQKGYE